MEPVATQAKAFATRRRPHIDLAIVCSDSRVDVATMTRTLQFQWMDALGKDSASRKMTAADILSASPEELERAKQYLSELNRARAVQAGASLNDENPVLPEEEPAGARQGKKKGNAKGAGGAAASKRAAGRKAEEDAAAMSPEQAKEMEEERQRLISTYLKPYQLVSVAPNSIVEFEGHTQVLFLYELLDQESVLNPGEDGNIGDVVEAFWKTMESAVPPSVEEIAVVWAMPDARLLRALRENPIRPSDWVAEEATTVTEVRPIERFLHPRLVVYANDSTFADPTLLPSAADAAKRTSRFSVAKKGAGTRKAGSQGSDNSRSASRGRGAKGGAKGAAPAEGAPLNFFGAGVDVDEALYECAAFSDFIEKQQLFLKQKADLVKSYDQGKPANWKGAPHLSVIIHGDDPLPRTVGAVENNLTCPTPLEAHLHHQRAVLYGNDSSVRATPFNGTLTRTLMSEASQSAVPVEPSRAVGPSGTMGAVSAAPDPPWAIIRAVQPAVATGMEEAWMEVCRSRVMGPLYEMASIVSLYHHWQSKKHYTMLPSSLQVHEQERWCTGGAADEQSPLGGAKPSSGKRIYSHGVSLDGLRSKLAPVVDPGIRVYEQRKLLAGEFNSFTAIRAIISQASHNVMRSRPLQLFRPSEPTALPPHLQLMCDTQASLGSKSDVPLFRADSREALLGGDNHHSMSVVNNAQPPVEEKESVDATPAPVVPSKGKEAKKPQGKRQSVSPTATPSPTLPPEPKPSEWVIPLSEEAAEVEAVRSARGPSSQEIGWLVEQYVKKGLGQFYFSKRGCHVSPASSNIGVSDVGRQMIVASDVHQALKSMSEYHGGRVGEKLLTEAEEENDAFLMKSASCLMHHLNASSFAANPPAPLAASCASGPLWNKSPRDLISHLTRALTHQEEQLRLSVERNITSRERAHVVQQALLIDIASRVGVLPMQPPTEQNPLVIEEVLPLQAAMHRLASLPLRFGRHIASVYAFAALERGDSRESIEAFTAMHSKNAENVYPSRRELQFWVGGVVVPPQRRKNLIWMFPVSGVLSVEEFVAWKRWENEKGKVQSPVEEDRVGFAVTTAPTPHSKLSTELLSSLASMVLNATNCFCSPKSQGAKQLEPNSVRSATRSSQPLDPETAQSSFRTDIASHAENQRALATKDVTFATEGRQVLYPFCDAVLEVVTNSYSRECRLLSGTELTAILHYSIPPPSAEQDADLIRLLSKSSAPPEDASYLTVRFDDGLIVTVANRQQPPVVVPADQKLSHTTEVDRGSMTSLRDTESITSSSAKLKTKAKGKKKEVKKGKQRSSGRTSIMDSEKAVDQSAQPTEAPPLRPQPSLAPPVAENGDMRLWTAREEEPSDGMTDEAGMTISTTRTIQPIDISVSTNNMTFHNRAGEGLLWFFSTVSPDSAKGHQASLSETIQCVHCNQGEDSVLMPSLEREVKRCVDESTGTVTRYFESGMVQTLFPDGVVKHRIRAVGDSRSNDFLFPDPLHWNMYCETVTLMSGAIYVRSVFVGSDYYGHAGAASDAKFSYVRLSTSLGSVVQFDPMSRCHTIVRADGVSVVLYYQNTSAVEAASFTGATFSGNWQHDLDFQPDATVSTASPLERNLNDRGIAEPSLHSTLMSSAYGMSLQETTTMYARVTLHADGTSISTFPDDLKVYGDLVEGESGVTVDGTTLAPSISSLINDLRVVHAACHGPVTWCVESPRTPRLFLLSLPSSLQQLTQTQHEWQLLFHEKPDAFDMESSTQNYEAFYAVFGDGTVVKRHVLSRPTRGSVVPFLETVICRPTDTTVRVIHDSGIGIVERSEDVRRNCSNAAAAAVGEGFAVFDLALGGFRMVDYLSHITEISDLYSPYGVTSTISPVSWEAMLKQLVHDTYTAHRLPKAQMEEMAKRKEQEEENERRMRSSGYCPPLIERMRELAEEFIISNGLLKPDVLHTLEKASRASKGLTKKDFADSFLESQTRKESALRHLMSRVAPIFFCQRANGEVVQFSTEASMQATVEQEGSSETSSDPIYLLRNSAAGEPGVQQVSLFRVCKADRNPPTLRSAASDLLNGREEQGGPHAMSHKLRVHGSLRDTVERAQKLSRFRNGDSFASHYLHADIPSYDLSIGEPSKFWGSFCRWQPRQCQPPRRFLQPVVDRKERKKVIEIQSEGDAKAMHENVRVFLQFQPISPSGANTIMNAELQRHQQLADLTKYHHVMENLFPGVPPEAEEEQKRLQKLYYAMREKASTD